MSYQTEVQAQIAALEECLARPSRRVEGALPDHEVERLEALAEAAHERRTGLGPRH